MQGRRAGQDAADASEAARGVATVQPLIEALESLRDCKHPRPGAWPGGGCAPKSPWLHVKNARPLWNRERKREPTATAAQLGQAAAAQRAAEQRAQPEPSTEALGLVGTKVCHGRRACMRNSNPAVGRQFLPGSRLARSSNSRRLLVGAAAALTILDQRPADGSRGTAPCMAGGFAALETRRPAS